MRLTTFILIASLVQVSAASFAQRITLSVNKASLKQIFAEIKKQTGYDVFYQAGKVKEDQLINANFCNTPLEKVMEQCLEGQPLTFTIDEKTVLIKEKMPSFLDRVGAAFQSIDVRGRVVNKDGNGLPGATISVKGGNKTTKSGSNGDFVLRGVEEGAALVVSYIGYISKEITARKEVGNLTLLENVGELDEVTINKGYYRTSKELNTGSVSTVTSASLSRQPVSDPLLALHGQVSGLYIAQQTGTQGTPATVRLRGTNSIANGNDPLYIIDGVPFSSDVATRQNVTGAGINISPFSTIGMENIEVLMY